MLARGTSEPSFPKFGVVVGDPVVSNATRALPSVRGYPVQVRHPANPETMLHTYKPIQYPASSAIITGGRQGIADIVNRLNTQNKACPNQTFSLVGYSQGASIMHKAATQIPTALYPKIKSVVMFGDPNLRLGRLGDQFPTALRAKLLQNCAVNDPVSSGCG